MIIFVPKALLSRSHDYPKKYFLLFALHLRAMIIYWLIFVIHFVSGKARPGAGENIVFAVGGHIHR